MGAALDEQVTHPVPVGAYLQDAGVEAADVHADEVAVLDGDAVVAVAPDADAARAPVPVIEATTSSFHK